MTEQKRPQQCEGCALAEHDAYICARWRLSYAVNELKKPFRWCGGRRRKI